MRGHSDSGGGSNVWWRAIALALISSAATFFTTYVSAVRNRPDRTEVLQMIEREGPYIVDRKLLLDRTAKIEALASAVTELKLSEDSMLSVLSMVARKNGVSTEGLRRAQFSGSLHVADGDGAIP